MLPSVWSYKISYVPSVLRNLLWPYGSAYRRVGNTVGSYDISYVPTVLTCTEPYSVSGEGPPGIVSQGVEWGGAHRRQGAVSRRVFYLGVDFMLSWG